MTHPLSSPGFDGAISTRVIFGAGCSAQVGALARELGGRHVLLVTDPGLVEAGHEAHTRRFLTDAGLRVTLFDRVAENPSSTLVDECAEFARSAGIDLIVGLGGGSSMDVAKGCNFILTNGGRMEDYWGYGKATQPMLPLIAIPTTTGTGSECQSFALIAHPVTHRKMACGDPKAAARVALLDPNLTLTLPRHIAAATGIDALAHSVETAVTRKRTPVSWQLSREAFRLCIENYPLVLTQPANVAARAGMLLGAAYAGAAIENSMLGATHSAANPLTAQHGLVHGHAIGLMLPHVVRFNAEDPATRQIYAELTGGNGGELADRLAELVTLAGLPRRLHDVDIPNQNLPHLAKAAAQEWTAQFNPRPVAADDFLALYQAAS
jgi:alcohol dehydrogenase